MPINQNTSFWVWLFFAVTGLFVISQFQSSTRILLIVTILLGALAIQARKNPNYLSDFLSTISAGYIK